MRHRSNCCLFFVLILSLSGVCGLVVKYVEAQPTLSSTAGQEVKQVINQEISLVPGAYRAGRIQLEANDRVAGQYSASNFHYYPNYYIGGHGEPITYLVSVDFIDPQGQTVYKSEAHEGVFNFTAEYSGVYTIRCYCSDNIYLVDNPIPTQVTTNYTIFGAPMEIDVLSPLNQLYKLSDVSLSYSVNRFGDWMGYSLDGDANVTLWDIDSGTPMSMGNSTLTGLSDGAHSLTVYANDTFGSMDSKTVSFTVGRAALFIGSGTVSAVDVASYSSIVTTLAIIAFVGVTLVVLVTFYYRKRR